MQNNNVIPAEKFEKRLAIKNKLDDLQLRLTEKGVIDAKVCWSPNVHEKSFEEVAEEFIQLLEAVLDGRHKPAEPLNDKNL